MPPIVVSTPAISSFWVNKDNPAAYARTGHILAPFVRIADAIAAGMAAGAPQIHVHLAPGDYSAETIALPQNIGWTFDGAVSGATLIGPITWSTSGNAAPVPQSYLVLRNCAPASITVQDAPVPATKALLILENSAVLGNITQTGTGNVPMLMAGISTASSLISGQNVSSLVLGAISYKSAVGLTNTQVAGAVTAATLWARGCQFGGAITCSGTACQLADTVLTSAPPHVTFSGSAGVLTLDPPGAASWFSLSSVLNNGALAYTSPVILRAGSVGFAMPALGNGVFGTATAAVPWALATDGVVANVPFGKYRYDGAVAGAGTVTVGVTAVGAQAANTTPVIVTLLRG